MVNNAVCTAVGSSALCTAVILVTVGHNISMSFGFKLQTGRCFFGFVALRGICLSAVLVRFLHRRTQNEPLGSALHVRLVSGRCLSLPF